MTIDLSLASTALAGSAAPAGLAVELEEAPLLGMITLKGDLASPAMRAAASQATGLAIPAVRRIATAGDRRALWMAPDEVLLQTPYAERGVALSAAQGALAGAPHLAVDVSDARAVFRLAGAAARDVLAKGAPIDLHPSAFGLGDLRRTRIATVAAAIYQTSDAPETFEVFCFRSYAPYLWKWLIASSNKASMLGVWPTSASTDG